MSQPMYFWEAVTKFFCLCHFSKRKYIGMQCGLIAGSFSIQQGIKKDAVNSYSHC